MGWYTLIRLGKFHLLLLHFPIALLIAAAAGEFWSLVRKSQAPLPAVRFCVLLGAVAAVPTVALGWLYALGGYGAAAPRILTLHRWLGTAAAVWACVTAACCEWDARRGVRGWGTRGLLFGGAALIGLAAHFGGMLAQGEDFFDW